VNADNIWNARVVSVEGTVVYENNRNPGQVYCRDTLTGKLANSDESVCRDLFNNPTPDVPCPLEDPSPSGITACFDGFGFPAPCICQRLLNGSNADLNTTLRQIRSGIVRTRSAPRDAPPSVADRLLRFTIRSGDLPLVGGVLDDRVPPFNPFSVGLTLVDADKGVAPTAQEGVKGVPMASQGWEIRVEPPNLQLDRTEEFVRSIEDIELKFDFKGFNLPQ
jgi:hypothetical protein